MLSHLMFNFAERTANVIQVIWKAWFELWSHCNRIIHGSSQREKLAIEHNHLLQELLSFDLQKYKIESHLRQALLSPTACSHPSHWERVKAWFAMYGEATKLSISQYSQRVSHGMKSLYHFFPRLQNSPTNQYHQDINAPPWKEGASPPSPLLAPHNRKQN